MCHDCGRLHRLGTLRAGVTAYCRRCAAVLRRHRPAGIERALAFTLAALALFTVAVTFPFLDLRLGPSQIHTTIFSGIADLDQQGRWPLAALVFGTAILAPGAQLLLQAYVLLPLHFGRVPPGLRSLMRLLHHLGPWSMVDVFMLGVLVATVKLGDMAQVVPGVALWAFAGTIVMLAASVSVFDEHAVWERLGEAPVPAPDARESALVACRFCQALAAPAAGDGTRCPRCGASLRRRKPASLQRTWALLLGALVLYVPANVLPIMRVTSLGKTQSDTIISGVIFLLEHGSWPLALVVFTASVVVPLAKITALLYLLISVQRGSARRRVDRTRLHRLTEAVGRWSMVDVFVVTILVAMVDLGKVATIEAQPGAAFFGAVVVTTMLAAMTFDPRLIWDARGGTA